mmetsp:Transcript_3264/g.2821  ORF Transcript_3264/g.2821 Transcript_3264/m.2821 type:complete len:94 (-) Transcript_3264:1032-1313(-)
MLKDPEFDSNNFRMHTKLILAYIKDRDYISARNLIDKGLEYCSSKLEDEESFFSSEFRYYIALIDFEKQNFKESQEILKNILVVFTKDPLRCT